MSLHVLPIRRSGLLILGGVLLFGSAMQVFAEPFVPKMNDTKSYKDALFGLQEVRDNIETVQCGGWVEGSDGRVVVAPSVDTCRPVISCVAGSYSCNGGGGYTFPKLPNGDIPICLSSADANHYLLLHELVHAKQFCEKAPGEPLATTQAECCSVEREAYTAQCSAIAADGLFVDPVNGIALTAAGCVGAGSDFSCGGYGPSACSGQVYPAGYINALTAAMARATTASCQEIVRNPSPRVQQMFDTIKGISESGGSKVEGYVPLPLITANFPAVRSGLPGRENNNPLGQAETGVGERSDFDFPDSAFGFSSACDVVLGDKVLDPDSAFGIKWAWDGNWDSDVQFINNTPGVFQVNWGPDYPDHERWCDLENDKKTATPRICEKLQKTLKRMAETIDALDLRPKPDEFCEKPPGRVVGYPPLVTKRYCFDPLYTLECHGTSGPTPVPTPTYDSNSPPQTTCRTPWYPAFDNKLVECDKIELLDDEGPYWQMIVKEPGRHTALSTSFYRHYGGDFSDWHQTQDPNHSILSVMTPDDQTWKIRSECYEFYANPVTQKEEDPKDIEMGIEREQCEIVILNDNEQSPKNPEWEEGNSGAQKETVKADASVTKEPIRAPLRTVPDPWMADPETNLSIVDSSRLAHLQRSLDDPFDITGIMGTILPTKMRASKSVPKNARTDTVSDDAERKFGKFFEAQQKELLKMTADPATRLIMPARFLLGLADDDPVFQYVKNITSRSDGTVAVTLKSGPEDVMNVLTSFLRVYVAPIQEVSLPVLIPLATEEEITTLIFQWQIWKEEEKIFATAAERASNDALADPIIEKLRTYRVRVREADALKSAETRYLQKLFEPQKKIREFAADWFKQNSIRLFQAALRGVQRRELRDVWRDTQEIMLLTDESQLQWCSNQRYSLAVYSLLDLPESWWGNGSPYSPRDSNFLPPDLRDLAYEQASDAEYDFSDMKFSREALLTPKLWFIEAAIKLPIPPLPGSEPPDPATIPDLPGLPGVEIFDSLTVPDITFPTPTLIEVPPPSVDLSEAISRMSNFLERMKRMYKAYSRFQPSFTDLPDSEQTTGNTTKIIHVENDLNERAARAFSRWMPERNVDYAGRTLRRKKEGFTLGKGKCYEDIVCYFLPPEDSTTVTWQWSSFILGGAELTAKADQLRSASLPPEGTTEDRNPFSATLPVLQRLFPDLVRPIVIDLTIPESTP